MEVTAYLERGPVYLAGEEIECTVTFTNTQPTVGTVKRSPETLAWASAQIICQCSVSESRVSLPKPELLTPADLSTTSDQTSFVASRGERGLTVLSTTPKILFCDLKLGPGESRSFTYRECLPKDAPPSYRGQSVKYSYKLTIGAQRFNCPTKLFRVPFRVLVVYGLNDISVYTSEDDLAPSNPFLEHQRKENSLLDVAMQVLATVTARKGPKNYNISNTKGKVGRFSLLKQAFKIGEEIIGIFDFTEATVPCVQFSVSLLCDEQIATEFRAKDDQAPSEGTCGKHHEFCLHTRRTHISIPIPLTATPSFVTDIVSLKYRLHFEFITSVSPLTQMEVPADPSESTSWMGQPDLVVETMDWDLPVKVFANNPVHCSSVSLLKTSATMHV